MRKDAGVRVHLVFAAATWILVVGSISGFAPAGPATASAPAPPPPVLDDSTYVRYHFTYAPPKADANLLRTEGKKWLGERFESRLRGQIKARLKRSGRGNADWVDEAHVNPGPWSFDGRGDAVMQQFHTDPPPDTWPRSDFDDSDWLRQRVPYLVGDFYRHVSAAQVSQIRLRARFTVPDPSKVRGLVFGATYRGGIRVFLNGKELTRGHVPRGPVGPDTAAGPYPPEAHHVLKGEFIASDYFSKRDAYWKKYFEHFNGRVLVPELPPWSEGRPRRRGAGVPPEPFWKDCRYFGAFNISRAGYERIQRLRNRRIEAPVPASVLRRGVNVLAIEIRRSPFHPLALGWYKQWRRRATWYHASLPAFELRADAGVETMLRRPPGVQAWAEDVHRRIYGPDYGPTAGPPRAGRIVAARNGTFGAQIGIGAERDLTGLKIAVSPLALSDDRPAKALPARVLYSRAHTMAELAVGDRGRRKGNWPGFDFPQVLRARYGQRDVPYFDHLVDAPPAKVPAGTASAAWVSVTVPLKAPSGQYAATITVSADGVRPIAIPLRVEVLDFRLPDRADFQTVVALEQSGYAVARQYNVKPWSEKHFRLLERTFAHLARVSNDWLNIPVLANTEFGNRIDSPIRWLRAADGTLRADFTAADRYIALATKYWGAPRVINFIVMHPSRPGAEASSPMDLPILDPATGRESLQPLDRRLEDHARRAIWRRLATTLHAHMSDLGLADRMHWGYTWDGPGGDPSLYGLLAEFIPGVGWTKGCHAWGVKKHYTAFATVYNAQVAVGAASKKGWKRPDLWLTYPRYWGTVIDCSDYSTPFSNRLMMERAIVAGSRGIGRVGADYWGDTYLDGMRGQHYAVGVPNLFLLYPGANGADTSIRFEVLCEGLQEAETRIFLEQALEKLGDAHAALKARVQRMLDGRSVATLLDPPVASRYQLAEAAAGGWQGRSRALYAAAGQVARAIGVDAARSEMVAEVPARGRGTVALRLRNWTSAPRRWRLASDAQWLVPGKTGGVLRPGQAPVALHVDGTALEEAWRARVATRPAKPNTRRRGTQPPPANEFTATASLTDVASGRCQTVRLTARVGKVFEVRSTQRVLNVAPGATGTLMLTLLNRSGAALSWRSSGSVNWLSARPASGRTGPGQRAALTVRAAPPDRSSARHQVRLVVREDGGVEQSVPLVVHIVPPYRRPAARPKGAGVGLEHLPKGVFVSYTDARGRRTATFWHPPKDRPGKKLTLGRGAKVVADGLIAPLPHEAVYKIAAAGYKAFAAEVGPVTAMSDPRNLSWAADLRMHFEVIADGRVVAQSGLMAPGDGPRLLVAEGLDGVKELRLRARVHSGEAMSRSFACWGAPVLYK